MSTIPRVVIAGTHSGCGKTTIASGIMSALIARNIAVQPFKVGPDFIDPSHHTLICRRVSRNLDPFMMGETGITETFCHAAQGAGIAVIEGVMGLFDGIDGSGLASTAHVARILDAPVILVVDVKGMSSSAHALIKGFREYDPRINIAGVIFNRVGSERHKEMISHGLGIPAIGWVPRQEEIKVPSRHLGLEMAYEARGMEKAGRLIEQSCDISRICSVAKEAPSISVPGEKSSPGPVRARIGIALDEAFCFYYQDNFDRLSNAGAELVFFSPISGSLPKVDALYLGGGYPELYADKLEHSACTADIRRAAESGTPIYAECGGLLYLCRDLTTSETFKMCDLLPARAEMTAKVQGLGYVDGESLSGTMFHAGLKIRGHEFHYSRVSVDPGAEFAFKLTRGKGISNGLDGLTSHSSIGTYTHTYFSDTFAAKFVEIASRNG